MHIFQAMRPQYTSTVAQMLSSLNMHQLSNIMMFRREGENPHAAQLFTAVLWLIGQWRHPPFSSLRLFFHGPGLGVLALNLASFPTKRANPSYFISWGLSRLCPQRLMARVPPRTGVLPSFAGAGEGWNRGQHSSRLMLCLFVHYGLPRPNQPLVG
jgi:hypothetical protein